MNENGMGARIAALRREKGLTQEQLADRLHITFQAVSKWENGQSCPDVTLLPELADIFGVSVDALFGRKAAAEKQQVADLPWPDDRALRAVLYCGHTLRMHRLTAAEARAAELAVLEYAGETDSVQSTFSVVCKDAVIHGNVSAGDSVTCEAVGGSVSAGDNVICGEVRGSVSAGDSVQCGNVSGSVEAGDSVRCGNIDGNATAGDSVHCAGVGGSVRQG